MLEYKCKDMGMNKEDEELVRMVNPTLKRRETILLFLIVVINGLKYIISNIRLDTCIKKRRRCTCYEKYDAFISE